MYRCSVAPVQKRRTMAQSGMNENDTIDLSIVFTYGTDTTSIHGAFTCTLE